MTKFSPAQAAQQHNRDAAGRYTEKLHTDPGDVLDVRCWSPPAPRLPEWVYDSIDAAEPDCEFADLLLERARTYQDPWLHTAVDETFPRLPSGRRARLVTDLTVCELATTWMSHGADAAWEAQAWDSDHPDADPPMLLVDYRDPAYELDDAEEVGVDWEMVAEGNAEAWVRRRIDLWRAAATEHHAAAAAAPGTPGRAEPVVA